MKYFLGSALLVLLVSACSTPGKLQSSQNQSQADTTSELTQEALFNARAEYIRGMREFELENYESALDHLMTAYIKLPEEAGVNYALADAYLKLDDLVNAAYYGKQATKLDPQNKWYHLKLADIYRAAGKNEATINELKAILDYYPDDTNVLYELAQTYTDYNEALKANQVYNRLLDVEGPSIDIHLQKFQNFNNLDMTDSALVELQRMRDLDPDNLKTLQTLSKYYMDLDKPKQAKQMLHNALDLNARDPESLVMMADIYIDEAQWDSAGTLLTSVVSDSLVSQRGKLEIARFVYSRYQKSPNQSDLKQVTENVLESFVSHESDYGVAHALMADYYSKVGQNDKAMQHLEATNRLMPSNDVAWRQRLQMLYQRGEYEKVIDIGQKADENVPQDAFIQFFVGNAYLVKGNNEQAVNWLRQASNAPARSKFKSVVYGSLGDALGNLKKWEDSDRAYEKALDLDSENHNAMNNYAYNLSKREVKLDHARQMILKALELDPGNPSYLDTAGWVFYKLGDYQKAENYIKKAIDSGEASAVVLEHMGNVYEKLGQLDKAREWWKKALEKDPGKKYLEDKISEI